MRSATGFVVNLWPDTRIIKPEVTSLFPSFCVKALFLKQEYQIAKSIYRVVGCLTLLNHVNRFDVIILIPSVLAKMGDK